MHPVTTALRWTAQNLGLLVAALVLHLLVAAAIYTATFALKPVAPPPPHLITDSIEMIIAESEAERPTEAAAPHLATSAPIPTPKEAAYLVAPDATLDLTPPDLDPTLPELDHPMEWTPPTLPTHHTEVDADLPEITLPPPEPLPPANQPKEAAGATARQDPPKLTTDIQTYLRKHYPKEARRNGWEGKVTLTITIGANGAVTAAEVHTTSGYATLDRAALKMMRKARYTHGPATLIQSIEYKLR